MPTLIAATVDRRPNEVAFAWEVDGDLEGPDLNPWLLSVDLIGGENGPIHQFGFRFRDGKVEERFYFDFVAAMNYYTPQVNPQRVGNTWQAVFPTDDNVATSGMWRATLSFDEPDNDNESNVDGKF